MAASMLAVGFAVPLTVHAQDRAPTPATGSTGMKPARQAAEDETPVLRRGDTLKLAFYERLDSDEEKWKAGPSKAQGIPKGFHQRTELTGEYVVQSSGMLSLPLLGEFPAGGRSVKQLRSDLNASFEVLIERRGFVNVLSVEHLPIQIVGAVKNPGSYPFRSGMTALHAVALAGGVAHRELEPWQRVEAGREFERLQRALERVKRLVARDGVLRSERDGEAPVMPELASVLGQRNAKILVAEEDWQRNLITASRAAQETTLNAAAESARKDLAIRNERVGLNEGALKLRRERADTLSQMHDKRLVSKPVMAQVQTELADANDRRLQAVIDIEIARQRVASTERDLQRHKLETGIEVRRAVSANTRDTMEAVADSEGIIEVMRTLTSGQDAPGKQQAFEIVRNTPQGTVILPAKDIAGLEPGDLVRVN